MAGGAQIDPRAIVHDGARLADGVVVGPFAIIGPDVEIGPRTIVESNVVVEGHVRIGADCRFFPFTTIGKPPQDLKYKDEPTRVEIGDRNVFREQCTVHRGTVNGSGVTRIGDDGYFMVGSHIAHDCLVKNHVMFANVGTLAGHVEVGDHAVIAGFSGVHQFCRVGPYAFIGGYSLVTRDALPYCLTVGNHATCFGINRVGLKRQGFAKETIAALERATRGLFRKTMKREDALAEVEARDGHVPEVRLVLDFVRSSKRGIAPIKWEA